MRKIILNNDLAVAEIQKQTRIQGIYFEDKLCFTKIMVATYFEVELRQDVPDINVGNISNRTPQLAIFDFRFFFNLAYAELEEH